jgi:hypothetical protein
MFVTCFSYEARKLLKSMSVKQGLKFDSPESAAEIPAFIQYFKLDMSEVLEPVESFETFNQVCLLPSTISAYRLPPVLLISIADRLILSPASVLLPSSPAGRSTDRQPRGPYYPRRLSSIFFPIATPQRRY